MTLKRLFRSKQDTIDNYVNFINLKKKKKNKLALEVQLNHFCIITQISQAIITFDYTHYY